MTVSVAPRAIYLRCSLKVGVRAGQNTDPTYFSDPLNFTVAEITPPAQENEELISNMISDYGSALASVPKPTEAAKVKLEFDTIPPQLLATVLGADLSEVTQSTGAVADEAITPVLGAWVKLDNQHIAAHDTGTEIVAETSGDVTIASSHYEVDLVNGMFKALDATGATVAKISYHKAARTFEQYLAGQAKSTYVQLEGEATEKVSGKSGRLIIWCASLSPSGPVDPVKGGYFKGTLEGTLVMPTGKSSPWTWELVTA